MENQEIISLLFAFHTLLFGVKLWAVYKAFSLMMFASSKTHSYMVVFKPISMFIVAFSALMVGSELWFLCSFFVNIDLYFYEYTAIFDEIFFTIIALLYLAKEEHNGKRSN